MVPALVPALVFALAPALEDRFQQAGTKGQAGADAPAPPEAPEAPEAPNHDVMTTPHRHPRKREPARCNIDATGRAVRLVSGVLILAGGLVLITMLLLSMLAGFLVWLLSVALLVGGAFQVYEGWAGWCVLRAWGVRTPF